MYSEFYMLELSYLLSWLFILGLLVIAVQDYKNKLIYLWSFYLLNIISLAYFFYISQEGIWKWLIIIYFISIITLDFLEIIWKQPKWLNKNRMINNTGIYDYWVYITIIAFFIDFGIKSFYDYLAFTIITIIGWILWFLITAKKYKKQIPLYVYAFFVLSWFIIYLLL